MADPLTRLQALEHAVAALAARVPRRSEQSVPNYLTIKPDGTIGALFTGGVQMIEGAAPAYAAADSLAWVDASGVAREYAIGYSDFPGHHFHRVGVNADVSDSAFIVSKADEAGASGSARIDVSASDSINGSHTELLLDSRGRSGFAQLDTSEFSTVGAGTFTWPAAGAASNFLNVALPGASGTVFGLGVPAGFVSNPGIFDAGVVVLAFPAGGGVCQFQAYTRAGGAPGALGTMTFSYLLWGS